MTWCLTTGISNSWFPGHQSFSGPYGHCWIKALSRQRDLQGRGPTYHPHLPRNLYCSRWSQTLCILFYSWILTSHFGISDISHLSLTHEVIVAPTFLIRKEWGTPWISATSPNQVLFLSQLGTQLLFQFGLVSSLPYTYTLDSFLCVPVYHYNKLSFIVSSVILSITLYYLPEPHTLLDHKG